MDVCLQVMGEPNSMSMDNTEEVKKPFSFDDAMAMNRKNRRLFAKANKMSLKIPGSQKPIITKACGCDEDCRCVQSFANRSAMKRFNRNNR